MSRSLILVASLAAASTVDATARAEPAPAGPTPAPAPIQLTSAKAKALLRGLKLAGVKPKVQARTWTYAARSVICRYTPDPDGGYVDDGDGLGTTQCEVDGKKLPAATSAVLLQGMHDADLPEPYYMGATKRISATALSCVDDQTKRGAAGPWACTLTPGERVDSPRQ
jgi:hypothetical protein